MSLSTRAVGTHLNGGVRSYFFCDFITHETLLNLHSESHFHLHGTPRTEPEVRVTFQAAFSDVLVLLVQFCF